jgi:signal transduction histidine kinase/CheY-like chemotaxis protein
VIAEAVPLYFIVRGLFVRPLERLARHNATLATGESAPDGDLGVADLLVRQDEIGALARALADERARSKDLLDSLETRVRERTAELERANESKGRFLANMSHELRTPLNGVIALADSLEPRQQDVESREMVSLIAASGRLLERVLTDVLDFSKIAAGQLELEEIEFDLETLVFRIAELHRAAAQAKGLAFAWRVDPQAMGRYRGDPIRLTQVLSNLLSNAVKFTEVGEVRLEVDRLAPSGDAPGLRFSVSDTGIGFDAEAHTRLFKRFEQADSSTTRRFGGTGLGLAICASLVELMDGRISAQSEPGRGSRFDIELPLARLQAALAAPQASIEAADGPEITAPTANGLSGLKVLLAEDHPTNQRIVELVLAQTGASLTITGDGAQALEALAAERFDVILMDMQMPVMDGLTAIRELRRRESAEGLPRTPVILLTANAMAEHVEAGRLAGADRHMAKPLRPAALIAAVAECAAGLDEAPSAAA